MVSSESVVVDKSKANNLSGDSRLISDEDFGEHRDEEVLPVLHHQRQLNPNSKVLK